MGTPGFSIFGGSEINVNKSLNRIEEEEFIEEGKKREAELKNLFQEAFDDLNEEDDESFENSSINEDDDASNDSGNKREHEGFVNLHHTDPPSRNESNDYCNSDHLNQFLSRKSSEGLPIKGILKNDIDPGGKDSTHYTHCFQKGIPGRNDSDIFNEFRKTGSGSYEELKLLYDVRIREIERLREDLETEHEAKEEALHHLTLSQSEKDDLIDRLTQAQHLLELSQEKSCELETLVTSLKNEILKLEQEKKERENELDIGRHQIKALQLKIATMERCDVSTNREKQMDAFIESMKVKHTKEVAALQQKIETLNNKLSQKEEDFHSLEQKLDEAERKRTALMIQKCDSVNRQESTLQALIDDVNSEKLELAKKVVDLQREVEMLKGDLDQYESVNKMKLGWGGSSSDEGEGFSRLTGALPRSRSISRGQPVSSSHAIDINTNLRDELHRSLLSQRAKRNEISKLQEQVRIKEIQIQEMKEKERKYLSQAERFKADMSRLMTMHENASKASDEKIMSEEVESLKEELEQLQSALSKKDTALTDLRKELELANERIRQEEDARLTQGEQFLSSRDQYISKIREEAEKIASSKDAEWKAKVEFAIRESDEIKRMYMELRSSKQEMAKELEVLKQRFSLLKQQKDHADTMLSDARESLKHLNEENQKLKADCEMKDHHKTDSSKEMDVSKDRNVVKLEGEVDRLRAQLAELPKKQAEELEGLKNKLDASKYRLIELEKRLKKEFQTEVANIKLENTALKEEIKNKDLKIAEIEKKILDKLPPTNSTPKSRSRENRSNSPDNSNLDNTVIDVDYKNKLESEILAVEEKMLAEHQAQLVAAEERIKMVTVKYYSEQMIQLEEKYKAELIELIRKERETFEKLKACIAEKEVEIEQLKKGSESLDRYNALLRQYEEDKLKFSDASKYWKKQVEELQLDLKRAKERMSQLEANLKQERKSAQKYKTKFDIVKRKLEQDKVEHVTKMKNHIENIISTINKVEEKANEKLLAVEEEYQQKERILREKIECNRNS